MLWGALGAVLSESCVRGSKVEARIACRSDGMAVVPSLQNGQTFTRGVDEGRFGLEMNPECLDAEMAASYLQCACVNVSHNFTCWADEITHLRRPNKRSCSYR